jgi:hypothetical protein
MKAQAGNRPGACLTEGDFRGWIGGMQ